MNYGKFGGQYVSPELKEKLDYNNHGGALFLGVNKPVIKAHGSSKRLSFMRAVLQAAQYAEFDISDKIKEKLAMNEPEGNA